LGQQIANPQIAKHIGSANPQIAPIADFLSPQICGFSEAWGKMIHENI
jgi:hypothetical protein